VKFPGPTRQRETGRLCCAPAGSLMTDDTYSSSSSFRVYRFPGIPGSLFRTLLDEVARESFGTAVACLPQREEWDALKDCLGKHAARERSMSIGAL
jgi:hypothetical protein